MAMIEVTHKSIVSEFVEITLPLSKSTSNRALILKALYPSQIQLGKLSDSTDTQVLQAALSVNEGSVDFGMAGTSVRFFLAYATVQGLSIRIDASGRGRERPITPLFRALEDLGGEWEFENENYSFPCTVKNNPLKGGSTHIDPSVSSQFVSALMLIAPFCENGLKVTFSDEPTSTSYIQLTANLMRESGIDIIWNQKGFQAPCQRELPAPKSLEIEADWSSASFVAQHIVTHKGPSVSLKGLKLNSSQGDSIIPEYFKYFGLVTKVHGDHLIMSFKRDRQVDSLVELDFTTCPDLSIPWIITLSELEIKGIASGLHTLPGKETDRLQALDKNLSVFKNLEINFQTYLAEVSGSPASRDLLEWNSFNDHRFAMSGALLANGQRIVHLSEIDSVSKSFPNFQSEFEKLGYSFKRIE